MNNGSRAGPPRIGREGGHGGGGRVMAVRDSLRAAVVKTNERWPFSRLNRIPYLLAMRAFVHLCGRYAEVKSVYLRHGMLRRDWIPAISDVDLTIVVDGALTTDQEFAFLESYWRSHARLQACFPMIRDLDILNERQVASWTRWTIRGYESRDWRLIHGAPTVRSRYVAAPGRVRHDAFNYALCLYLGYFLERHRYAGYDAASGRCGATGGPPRRDPAGLLSWVVRRLDAGVPSIVHATSLGRTSARIPAGPLELHPPTTASASAFAGEGEIARAQEALECIYLTEDASIVVLKDDLDDACVRRCAGVARHRIRPSPVAPVILSRRVFEYTLRAYAPLLYTQLARRRVLAYGRDLLPDINPPSEYAFTDVVLEQMVNVLAFPRRRAIFLRWPLDRRAGEDFEWELHRSLSIRLYLDTGSIPRCRERLIAETRARYREHFRRLGKICGRSASGDRRSVSRELFGLFRDLADELDQQLETIESLDAR
jgi:hypothetical protein